MLLSLLAAMSGGIPLVVGLGAGLLLTGFTLPPTARRYLLQRLRFVCVTLFVTMGLVWILVHNYRDDSRLDDAGIAPALRRYGDWIGGLVSGEMGQSQYSETVGEGIARSLPISFQLLLYSQIIAVALAVPLALIGAQTRGRLGDCSARAIGLLGLSLPVFMIGPLLVQLFGLGEFNLFGAEIGWRLFPVVLYTPLGDGLGAHLASMALPTLTLAFSTAAVYSVLLRSEMLQQLRSDHVLLARSKGLAPSRIVRVHALRPASPAAIAAIAAQSGLVLGNMVIVERIFSLPGFGDYVLVAIGRRDELAVVGAIFVAAAILAVVNLLADAALLVVDPRIEGRALERGDR